GDITPPGKMKLECELKEAVFVKPKRNLREISATKKHIQCTFIERELLGFLWFEIILYKQRLIELFGVVLSQNKKSWYLTAIREQYSQNYPNNEHNDVNKAALDGWYDKRMMIDNYTLWLLVYTANNSNLAARVNIGMSQLRAYLQCTQEQLKTHLTSQFHSGMSLMNYGVLWNLDHTIPVFFAKDKLKALCHHSNIQPMLITENSSKCADLGPPKGVQVCGPLIDLGYYIPKLSIARLCGYNSNLLLGSKV
ncbi:hypothetical protein PROFUN_16954, partial [Planoprotostelium fungivorum]